MQHDLVIAIIAWRKCKNGQIDSVSKEFYSFDEASSQLETIRKETEEKQKQDKTVPLTEEHIHTEPIQEEPRNNEISHDTPVSPLKEEFPPHEHSPYNVYLENSLGKKMIVVCRVCNITLEHGK